jgi:hypothetical protein
MKRSPVLDEVLDGWGTSSSEGTSNTSRRPEYEVLRMVGVEEHEQQHPQVSFNPESVRKRRHRRQMKRKDVQEDLVIKPPMKRLRLILGKETVSTVNYN